MKKVFIDGKAGTTGLRIYSRLAERNDICLLTLSDEQRKDTAARKQMLNGCDIAFLCLPDDAAREAVSLIENPDVVVIDASTAHRTLPNWAYGFPELSYEFENKIASSKRIAVPGCHASGFIALAYPLVKEGIIDQNELLNCYSITGYSGGGKKMIAEYEEGENQLLKAPRNYALTQNHKHLKEMRAIANLDNAPIFIPTVSNFYSGMLVTLPIFNKQLKSGKSVEDIKVVYKKYYDSEIVCYKEGVDEDGFMSGAGLSGKDSMEISVFGNEERILLCARYDNLGKGASGAAIECMNIAIGQDKKLGLVL